MPNSALIACLFASLVATIIANTQAAIAEVYDPSRFEVTKLATELNRPMELAVAPDGRVFYIELEGKLQVIDPKSLEVAVVAEFEVETGQENGLIGLALDPNFADNDWIYLQYSPPEFNGQYVSRFKLHDGKLDRASEKLLLKYEEQRIECCHHAGSLEFGPHGCLFIGTGDNTHPAGDSQGYAPIDERAGREPWDAQKSASNTKSYNGKILRIRPQADGTYEIPDGNLFPRDGAIGHPEIYAMGCRNPWRLNVDQKTGHVYWGEVGPDAGGDGPRGPRGYDEINQAKQAGNFGWPYVIANNRPYNDVDFATGKIGTTYDIDGPINESPSNTGARVLPPAQPAFIFYPYGDSAEFPELGNGGRTACAGPVYHFDVGLDSKKKFPPRFDNTLFIFEWSRNWIKAVHLDENSGIKNIESFLPDYKFSRPIDMQFGPEGSLYVVEYGETWGVNQDARIIRIDYVSGNRRPVAIASATNNIGRQPLQVRFSSKGSLDRDPEDKLTYEWRVSQSKVEDEDRPNVLPTNITRTLISTESDPIVTFKYPGVYNAELVVTDPRGATASASVPVLVGNGRPTVRIMSPADGGFFDPGEPLDFEVYVSDPEDGTTDSEEADQQDLDELDSTAVLRTTLSAKLLNGPLNATDAAEDMPPGMRLMKGSDCFNCHSVDQKRVGPPLIDIANKYRTNPHAIEQSIQRVQKGSTGVWGKIPMIPHSQHTETEIHEMVSWIYALEPGKAARVYQGFVGSIPTDSGEPIAGYFELTASYVDAGFNGIPALASSARSRVRSRLLEAEHADHVEGALVLNAEVANNKKFVGAINHAHYLRFDAIHTNDVKRLTLRLASAGAGGRIEIRTDKLDGPVVATVNVDVNGSWEEFYERTVPFEISGTHDLYFVFVNDENRGGLMNVDSIYLHGK